MDFALKVRNRNQIAERERAARVAIELRTRLQIFPKLYIYIKKNVYHNFLTTFSIFKVVGI